MTLIKFLIVFDNTNHLTIFLRSWEEVAIGKWNEKACRKIKNRVIGLICETPWSFLDVTPLSFYKETPTLWIIIVASLGLIFFVNKKRKKTRKSQASPCMFIDPAELPFIRTPKTEEKTRQFQEARISQTLTESHALWSHLTYSAHNEHIYREPIQQFSW